MLVLRVFQRGNYQTDSSETFVSSLVVLAKKVLWSGIVLRVGASHRVKLIAPFRPPCIELSSEILL